jgi:MT0933-like antitoxin protein
MGIVDSFRSKAEDLAGQHTDQASDGLDQAGDFVNEKTGNRFADQVDQAGDLATDQLGNFGDQAGDAASDMSGQASSADIPWQATNMQDQAQDQTDY